MDDPETHKRFSALPQPRRISTSSDQTVDASQRIEETVYTPPTTVCEYDGPKDEPNSASEQSDEGLKQMKDAVYVDSAELPLGLDVESQSPSSPVDVPGVLETIDTDTKKGTDVIDGDLDSILPFATGVTDEEWALCCSFLFLNPHEHKDPVSRSVPIPHTDVSITPRQYLAALTMLGSREHRDIYGGVLADVPGTGKTHTCIATVLLRALIAYNMAEVKKEWETRDYEASKGKGSRVFKHLPHDASAIETCPCGNLQGIVCYANAESITRIVGGSMSRGVSLILAPQGVIEEWKTLLLKAKMNRKFFEPCLVHTTTHRELTGPPYFEKRFQLKATPRQDAFAKDYKPKVVDFDYAYTIDTEPAKQPERFIILTTHQIAKLRETFQIPVMVTVAKKKERMHVYGLPVGCMLVDEFHKVRTMGNPVVELAQDHKRIMGDITEFWSVTGTTMPKSSFLDLESTIAILERPTWSQPDHMNHDKRIECLKELENAYFEAVSADNCSEAAVEAFRERASQFFEGLIIRHTMESRFFGQRITKVKEMKPVKMTFTTAPEYLDDLQALADQVKDKIRTMTQSDSYEQVVRSLPTYIELTPLQVASTFPAAARLILDGKIKFDVPSMRALIKKAKGDVTSAKEFTDLTDAIISDSPKLAEIVSVFLYMEKDHSARPKPAADGDSSPNKSLRENRQMKKLVVITPTLGEAIFLYLGLRDRLSSIRGAKPVLLHGDLLASEKQKMTSDFQALTPGSARILVTPYEVGGTGLNLQAANYQVLTGPLRTKDYELQAFARTNREGNGLRLHHWLYLTDDNPADRLIVARQANRRVGSDPFDVGAEFRVEGEDGE
ncbi:hypothetical protein GE09DRAFT_1132717 [Coniochaeta sp. 2T2.1]|nr:hypothetical protein GE09DRAFT_1132717 [Coniochaeta sp. 2T2.1]